MLPKAREVLKRSGASSENRRNQFSVGVARRCAPGAAPRTGSSEPLCSSLSNRSTIGDRHSLRAWRQRLNFSSSKIAGPRLADLRSTGPPGVTLGTAIRSSLRKTSEPAQFTCRSNILRQGSPASPIPVGMASPGKTLIRSLTRARSSRFAVASESGSIGEKPEERPQNGTPSRKNPQRAPLQKAKRAQAQARKPYEISHFLVGATGDAHFPRS